MKNKESKKPLTIGLISINMHTKSLNFACPIHTWAFQHFLDENGIKSTVIDYVPNYNDNFPSREPVPYYEKKYSDQLKKKGQTPEQEEEIAKKLKQYKDKLDGYTALCEERKARFDKFQKFIDENYVKTDITYSETLLDGADPGFDCYICVTDVIWACDPYWGFDRGFLLDRPVMEDKWKIAYAASRGVPKEFDADQEKYFFDAISKIEHIGVREQSLKKYIEENLPQKPVQVVLDPVLLLGAKEYDRFIAKPEEEKYVVLYYAMERPKDLIGYVKRYAKKRGLIIVELTHIPIDGGIMSKRINDADGLEVHYLYDIGPEEWLGYIKYAECIFTNSFHASCFSILFHKKFFVGNRNGDKVSHLLELFGLERRKISDASELQDEIDYAPVEEILQRERKKSADFILGAIRELESREMPTPNPERESVKRAQQFPIAYNSKTDRCGYTGPADGEKITLLSLQSGNLEYRLKDIKATNSGQEPLLPLHYTWEGHVFRGWHLRVRIHSGNGSEWFWVKKDGSLAPMKQYDPEAHADEALFANKSTIPYIPAYDLSIMVADGVWSKIPSKKTLHEILRGFLRHS
ncbi:MAG: polysaccharide pyruvyl transferase family protein [Clostridiales bacterium]|nr:polysaccharide pyruvyl transferase family protein [Clostridiales bacterium]